MTKYLFLTTIFAINHAGRQKKEEVSPVPSNRSQGMSSSDSSREVSPDPQERIRELEKENAQLRSRLIEERAQSIQIMKKMRMPDSNLKSDAMYGDIISLNEALLSADEQILIFKKELMPKYRALKKEYKSLQAQKV